MNPLLLAHVRLVCNRKTHSFSLLDSTQTSSVCYIGDSEQHVGESSSTDAVQELSRPLINPLPCLCAWCVPGVYPHLYCIRMPTHSCQSACMHIAVASSSALVYPGLYCNPAFVLEAVSSIVLQHEFDVDIL